MRRIRAGRCTADISDPASKVPIEIEEGYVETLCEKSTDCALAGSAWADQPNHRMPSARRRDFESATISSWSAGAVTEAHSHADRRSQTETGPPSLSLPISTIASVSSLPAASWRRIPSGRFIVRKARQRCSFRRAMAFLRRRRMLLDTRGVSISLGEGRDIWGPPCRRFRWPTTAMCRAGSSGIR